MIFNHQGKANDFACLDNERHQCKHQKKKIGNWISTGEFCAKEPSTIQITNEIFASCYGTIFDIFGFRQCFTSFEVVENTFLSIPVTPGCQIRNAVIGCSIGGSSKFDIIPCSVDLGTDFTQNTLFLEITSTNLESDCRLQNIP